MKDERLFKVVLGNMASPFQAFKFKVGKKYVCDDFDTDPNHDCSRGFYATGIEGLLYAYRPGRRIFEVAVGGKNVNADPIYKRRWEMMELTHELFRDEIWNLARKHESTCGYLLSEAIFPINPLLLPPPQITDNVIALLTKWASVVSSVGGSVWGSVLSSVGGSVVSSVGGSVVANVWGSVLSSVGGSVVDSVWAYMGALFPGIKNWKYIDHDPGVYPFQYGANLWRMGLVPSYDGRVWRLHAGTNADIVWEGQ